LTNPVSVINLHRNQATGEDSVLFGKAHNGFNIFNISRRIQMVEVTTSATQQIAEYFKGKTVSPVRIFLNEGG
jgi:hypothetical protein